MFNLMTKTVTSPMSSNYASVAIFQTQYDLICYIIDHINPSEDYYVFHGEYGRFYSVVFSWHVQIMLLNNEFCTHYYTAADGFVKRSYQLHIVPNCFNRDRNLDIVDYDWKKEGF